MKKLSVLVFSAVMIFSLSGCLTINSTRAYFKKAAESGTPENSVVFFGAYSNAEDIYFSQMDPDFPAHYMETTGEFFCSEPIPPGSTYRLEYLTAKNSSTKYISHFPLSFKGLDIHVPKEPGLYYVGSFSGITAAMEWKNEEISPVFFIKQAELSEKKLLKEVLSNYKGTEWESVIRKRMEEL